jgi:plasmid replication initiation protein
MDESKILNSLFNQTNIKKYEEILIEQYKLYLEMTDRISARRHTANSFFQSINTLMVGVVGYLRTFTQTTIDSVIILMIPLAGIILCYIWYRLIRSYRDLNKIKFKVIHEIEKKLPISPYDAEWELMERGKNRKLYLPFTEIEMKVPLIFMGIHFLF